jgi:peroxiredoxin
MPALHKFRQTHQRFLKSKDIQRFCLKGVEIFLTLFHNIYGRFSEMRKITLILVLLALSVTAFAQQRGDNKPLAEGFSAVSLDGKTFDLSELKGSVVAIAFWSTRCAICHAEIPKLNKLVDDNQGKNVVFLAFTNENEAKVQPYLAKNPLNYNIIPNSFGTLLKYADKDKDGNINMPYPAYFLINQQGEIEYRSNGWDKTERISVEITRLLNKPSAR